MKDTVTDRIAQMKGKYQFLAESCASPTKRKVYEEASNDLSALLEYAQESRQCEGGKNHDVKA